MTGRKARHQELEARREKRNATSHNTWRKIKYHDMAATGALGQRESERYRELLTLVKSAKGVLKSQGITLDDLPAENPTRKDYAKLRGIYSAYTGRDYDEGEELAELLESHDDRIARRLF